MFESCACLQIETCRKVENSLNRLDRKGIHMRVLPFHAAITRESQLANMEEFCSSQVAGKSLFLVCTDRCALPSLTIHSFYWISVSPIVCNFRACNMMLVEFATELQGELTFPALTMLYSLTFPVIQVNIYAVLEELLEVLEGRVRPSYLWLVSRCPLLEG